MHFCRLCHHLQHRPVICIESEKMMKGVITDDNLSNLTSASGEISASSGSKIESGTLYPQQYSSTTANQAPPQKRKRNLPGNPDPDAEVVALSPKALLATNRFICEICNKGFQRDQNLQLHRRGHNLPWKLKQRSNKEVVKKKVYVCPEVNCVHHDRSRALGDLTGIKKHFCRKHGEKKWKCEKCSKRYAVQSDWKAHSRICGTREYRCDCGTLFSRRDSFITHRAFCDALAEESGRANPLFSSQQIVSPASHMINLPGLSSVKRERDHHHHQDLNHNVFNPIPRPENTTPPWLACQPLAEADPGAPQVNNLSTQLYPTSLEQSFLPHDHHQNPSLNFHTPAPSPHMSATALLQKAAQMGVTMSKPSPISPSTAAASSMLRPRQAHDLSENAAAGFIGSSTKSFSPYAAAGSGLCLSSREVMGSGVGHHGSVSFGNKAAVTSDGTIMECIATSAAPYVVSNLVNSSLSFDGNFQENLPSSAGSQLGRSDQENRAAAAAAAAAGGGWRGGGNDGLTRDFLGLEAFSHKDFLNMTGVDHVGSSSIYRQQDQHQAARPWQG